MVTKRLALRAIAGFALWAGFGEPAQAQLEAITPEKAFKVMPRQPGVNVNTPTPDQVPNCKVETIPDPKTKAPMAYVVRDPSGKPVRQFVSYDGTRYNILVFYVNGEEAYREVYPPNTTDPVQFRWLGPNGTKWGLDKDRDGKIDEWVIISPEEVSQELLQAVLTKDVKRAEALVLTKANLDVIGLPAQSAKAQDLLGRAANAARRVTDVSAALKATNEAKWMHVELNTPQATSADALGARDDLIVHKSGTILVQDGTQNKFMQTGEMVQIGRAWKLVDGPSIGGASVPDMVPALPEGVRALVEMLNKLDNIGPAQPLTTATIAAHSAKRAEILEQIVAHLPPQEQEMWVKQLVDSLSSAAEGEKVGGKHITRLKQFKDSLVKGPNTNLAAYATYHYLVAENSIILSDLAPGKMAEVQEQLRKNLDSFIKAYPSSDEAAEAMLRLAMAYEFMSTKDGETKAKEWYEQLSRKLDKNQHVEKAKGAIRRMDCEGKPLELSGPDLDRNNAMVNAASALRGKVVLVYYCASWSRSLADDAKTIKALVNQYGPKGLEVVTVCLDHDANNAKQTAAALPGLHLYAPGGLDGSPLAAHYGIVVVPHMFVVNKDGNIVNRSAQAMTAEDDVKKLLP
jgi:hypothetical protein